MELSKNQNMNLLKHEFINTMLSSILQPCITKPMRIVSYSMPSLVDNIFVNIYDKTILSGNLLDKITDHHLILKLSRALSEIQN